MNYNIFVYGKLFNRSKLDIDLVVTEPIGSNGLLRHHKSNYQYLLKIHNLCIVAQLVEERPSLNVRSQHAANDVKH